MATADGAPGDATPPIVTIAGPRATIRLNRPRQHNRIEPDDLAVLRETFARIDDDPRVRVLVLTGTGKSFSSGYHIGALVERHAAKPDNAPGNEAEPGGDSFERCACRRSPRSTAASTAARPTSRWPATSASGSRACSC
jgi:enoyl-CoA hydratase/carnithine racemase